MNRFAKAALLALTFIGQVPATSAEGVFVMPRNLVEHAKEHRCKQIDEFYNRPGLFRPPYVFDEKTLSPDPGFVYWCKRPIARDGREDDYILVINPVGGFEDFSSCPSEIKGRGYPNGLSVEAVAETNLSSFFYLKNPKRRGPNLSPTKLSIVSGDEISDVYYCHNGQWLFLSRD